MIPLKDKLAPNIDENQRRDFVVRLVAMQAEALQLGLPVTARALYNGPIRAVGWELAGDINKAVRHVAADQA